MDNFNNKEIALAIGNLTVMQLISLTKEMELKWNLKALPVFTSAPIVVVTDDVKEVQTEFDVVLVSFAVDKKMTVVKLVREILAIGLLDSKTLVESLPKTIKEGVSKEDAEAIKVRFTEAGVLVEIK
jgi:large subunit ribosomal protein L7/L12